MSKIGKSIETKSRLHISWGWEMAENREWILMDTVVKYSKIDSGDT